MSGNAKTGQGGRAIWLISTVTGVLRVLRDDAWSAALSRDNSTIAFRNRTQNEIWLMGPNGENPRRVLAAPEGYMFERTAWSPDGGRLAYIKSTLGLDEVVIESIPAGGGNPTVMLSGQRIMDFCWTPDGRILVSLSEPPPNEYDSNLWEFRADPRTGKRLTEPRRVTNWARFAFRDITLSRDGKRMAFANRRSQSDVFLAELSPAGNRLLNERRFTLDERIDWPGGWTRDGKLLFLSDRNGNLDIFRQGIGDPAPEILVSGPDDKRSPQPSPDGTWILYLAWPKSGCCVTHPTGRMMRVRAAGGAPEPVFEVRGYPGSAQVPRLRNALSARGNPDFRCPSHSGASCILAEMEGGRLIFTSFDPIRGRTGEVARFDSPERDVSWDLSPDGSRLAVLPNERTRAVITVIPVQGGPRVDILVKEWSSGYSLAWSSAGESFLMTDFTTSFCSLLRVSWKGEAEILRRTTSSMERPAPSPGGRHLAFAQRSDDSNIWVIENF